MNIQVIYSNCKYVYKCSVCKLFEVYILISCVVLQKCTCVGVSCLVGEKGRGGGAAVHLAVL